MAKQARWTEAETIQVAKDLVGVATRFQERLADRDITPEFLAECTSVIAAVEAAAAGQPVLLGAQKGATASLEQSLRRAATLTAAVREAIQRKFPRRADIHKVFGVGGPNASTSVKNALAAIDAVLDGANAYPTETAAARVRPRDLDALRELRATILAADAAQEAAKGKKKGGTSSRNRLLEDVTSRVDDILAAARLEFAEEPDILREFTGPIPTKRRERQRTA
ncbi:MAG TPA: hypothetical protein VIL20_24570 [Sandaracinaceae bacterium]